MKDSSITTYSLGEVQKRLEEVPGWSYDEQHLRRTVEFSSFRAASEFLARLALAAEELLHTPTVHLDGCSVTFLLRTPETDGITGRDFLLASQINLMVDEPDGT